ncbi:hypothetical protein GQ457_15G015840 [Hibiscus cannabinus]
MFSRTHELTNKLISKAPRSNCQATKRTPSLSVTRRKRNMHKPEKNHNFDFFLKRFVWILNLNDKLAKISTKSTRINKRAKSFWDFCSLVYSGSLSRDLDVISVEIKDSSALCHQEIKIVDFSGEILGLVFSPVNRRTRFFDSKV